MENNELFMDIKGYEDRYQVSTDGRVWSIISQRYLKPIETKNGYLVVHLTAKNGKKKLEYIHRLVALTFIDNPGRYPEVNHKDENKHNNNVENLEWCNRSYNNTYGNRMKNIRKPVAQYDKNNNLINVYPSITEASRQVQLSISGISQCCNNIKKSLGGFRWKFYETKGDN